jgi:hypothetical protein
VSIKFITKQVSEGFDERTLFVDMKNIEAQTRREEEVRKKRPCIKICRFNPVEKGKKCN